MSKHQREIDMEPMPGLARRVAELREAAGLSRKQLARLAGVAKEAVCNLERRRGARPEVIEAVARALGVGTDWLLRGDETEGRGP